MPRPVLGNDPFLRGAPAAPAEPATPPTPRIQAKTPAKSKAPVSRRAAVRKPQAPMPQPADVAAPDGHRGWATRLEALWSRSVQLAGGLVEASRALPLWPALGGAWAALQTGLGVGRTSQLDAYGADSELLARLRPLRDFFYGRYFRVSVQGADRIPSGPVLLVGNHAGALPLDGWILCEAVRRERPDLEEPRWLMEDQFFGAPFLGTLYNRLGALRASPENAERLLGERRPVAVFPEGIQGTGKPFAQRYRLQRFGRGGFVKLALRGRIPVVPVALVGGEETLPLLAKLPFKLATLPYVPVTAAGVLPLPVKWSVQFGPPVDLEGLSAAAADDLGAVQRLTERTREAIQSLLDQALQQRRSVFSG